MNPRILIINPWTGYIGPNTFFQQFVIQSLEKSCKITVIYPFKDEISLNLESKGVTFIYNKILEPIHYSSKFLKISNYFKKEILLFIFLKKIKINYDVFVFNSELFSFSVFSLPKHSRKFNIIHSLSFTNNINFSRILFKIHYINNITNIAVSKTVMYKIKTIYNKSNTIVFYNGVNVNENYKKIHISDPNNKIQLLSVLHPVPHKGVHHLIEVLNKLNLNNYKFICNIVGWEGTSTDVIYKKNIEDKILTLGLKDKINFYPATKNIIKYFENADILIHPSESESFGYVIAEAMSYELPIVAFNVGAIPEIVQNNTSGYLIEPFNIAEMTNFLIKLMNSKELRINLGLNGKSIVTQHFNKAFNMNNLITYCLNR